MKHKVYLIGAYLKASHKKPIAVKVGFATNPETRLSGLQCGNHCELKIIATWSRESIHSAREIERKTHKTFKGLRLKGEWFEGKKYLEIIGYINGRISQDAELHHLYPETRLGDGDEGLQRVPYQPHPGSNL